MANASPSSAAHAPPPSSPPASPHASGGGGRDEEEAHGDFERDGDLTAEEMELERKAIFKCVAAACVSPWRAAETTGDGLGFSPCRESSGVQRERSPTETGGADRVHIARVLRARTLHGEPTERGGAPSRAPGSLTPTAATRSVRTTTSSGGKTTTRSSRRSTGAYHRAYARVDGRSTLVSPAQPSCGCLRARPAPHSPRTQQCVSGCVRGTAVRPLTRR
jgi:hypothetical protein